MTIKNKIHNWYRGIKRFRGKGCVNCGITRNGSHITKYDWSKGGQFEFQSKPYHIGDLIFETNKLKCQN